MSLHNTIQKRRLSVITYQYDTATEDVMDYAGTNSITPPKPSRVIALDQLIKGLKRAGIWAKLDVLSNFAYNDTNADEFALIDLVRVEEMTAFGGMIYTADGYEGDPATSAYIDTEYNPATDGVNYLLDDACFGGVLFKEFSSGNNIFMGSESTVINLLANANANHRINRATNTTVNIDLSGTGLKALHREASTVISGVSKDVYTQLTSQSAANSISGGNLLIFSRSPVTIFSNAGAGCSFAGASLTYAETQTFRALYNAYLKQIGLTQFA